MQFKKKKEQAHSSFHKHLFPKNCLQIPQRGLIPWAFLLGLLKGIGWADVFPTWRQVAAEDDLASSPACVMLKEALTSPILSPVCKLGMTILSCQATKLHRGERTWRWAGPPELGGVPTCKGGMRKRSPQNKSHADLSSFWDIFSLENVIFSLFSSSTGMYLQNAEIWFQLKLVHCVISE